MCIRTFSILLVLNYNEQTFCMPVMRGKINWEKTKKPRCLNIYLHTLNGFCATGILTVTKD